LFFLAPAVGELLSGSAPPGEFFNPISLLLLSSLYGSGALIVRELKIRWKKGYVSMFILGAAYGVIEEGLMVKSFFDPEWMDLGIMGVYGRWLEVNWVWSEWLTIYHGIFSIAIPITLVELAYPERMNDRWLSNKKFAGVIILLICVTAFGYTFLTTYRPSELQYILSLLLVFALTVLAWKIPKQIGRNGSSKPWKPKKLLFLGLLVAIMLFLFFMAGPYFIDQSLFLMMLGLVLIFSIFNFIKKFDWNKKTLYNKFSFTAGALCFFIVLSPLQELDTSRTDNTQGMLIVGIVSLIMLLILRKNLKKYVAINEHREECKVIFCSICQLENPYDAIFCQNCGNKIAI